MKNYPADILDNIKSVADALRFICRTRKDDITDFNNLENIFMRGRKVGKIPTASTDITGNKVGDFNYSATYFYLCVDNGSGVAVWRRASLGAW